MTLIFLFALNILLVAALWHMDVNQNLDKFGQSETRGMFKIKPEKAYPTLNISYSFPYC
jgi:hypothetical protein